MARVLIPTAAIAALVLVASLANGALTPAAASAPDGQSLFAAKCQMCHSSTEKGGSSIGPHLFGVVGRKAGSQPGFVYSHAMKTANITWTEANLKAYIADPQKVVPGNRMPFPGDHTPAEVDAIVAYLATLH